MKGLGEARHSRQKKQSERLQRYENILLVADCAGQNQQGKEIKFELGEGGGDRRWALQIHAQG